MLKLPDEFCQTIRQIFAEDGRKGSFEAFLESFKGPPSPALRLNGLKGQTDELWTRILSRFALAKTDFEKVRWTQEAYYLPDFFLPSQTVSYLQGLFYLQEASATLPATILAAKPGDLVLDLCAAPGGKSTKLLSDMKDEGLLVCNEINLDRARVLLRNLEQWGGTQTILTHSDPAQLKDVFSEFFDKILVDAPCSGEGMFLRDAKAIKSWEAYSVADCAALQSEILSCADKMLKPGGELVYSTCTFNRQENEERIAIFMQNHPDYEILPARERLPEPVLGLQDGLAQVMGIPTEKTLRIWPHLVRGEGHFCAILRKKEQAEGSFVTDFSFSLQDEKLDLGVQMPSLSSDSKRKARNKQATGPVEPTLSQAILAYEAFVRCHLTEKGLEKWYGNVKSRLYLERHYLHLAPEINPSIEGVHLLKRGLLLGELKLGKKVKFSPSHAWAMAISPEDFRYVMPMTEEDPRVFEYIAGQTLSLDEALLELVCRQTVYVLLVVEDFPLGFVQSQPNGLAKNLYPRSWVRRLKSPWEDGSASC